MSLLAISQQLPPPLEQQIISFELASRAAIDALTPRSGGTDDIVAKLAAKASYDRIQKNYQQIYSTLSSNMSQTIDQHSYDILPPGYLENTALLETLHKAYRAFTDCFLTSYPDVSINYGDPCILLREKWSLEDQLKQDSLARYRAMYPNFRRIRGDGNCFFSAITVTLLEYLVQSDQVRTLIDRICNHPEWNSPGRDVVIELLIELADTPSILEARLQNNQKILCFVNLFRCIAAEHMIKNRGHFEGFLDRPFDEYITDTVLKMGENAEHYAILALCKELDFPFTIHDVGIDTTDRGTHLGSTGQSPLAALCRNGEHYFIFYNNDTVTPSALQSQALSPLCASASSWTESFIKPTGALFFEFTPSSRLTFEIRGNGPGMSDWQVGIPLENPGENIWSWTCYETFTPFEYKIVGKKPDGELIWESGKNRTMKVGDSEAISPNLDLPAAPSTVLTIQWAPKSGTTLELRGKGGDWSRGLPLNYVGNNTWTFELNEAFEPFEYKIVGKKPDGELIWESGKNRTMKVGDSKAIPPNLDLPAAPSTVLTIQWAPKSGTTLELRGKGGDWSRGLPLNYVGNNTWTFELNEAFEPFEYKIVGKTNSGKLLWQLGKNRTMTAGKSEAFEIRLQPPIDGDFS